MALIALIAVLAFAVSGCDAPLTAESALAQAEAQLQEADPAGAEKVIREALADTPQDARLRIALARAELASGRAAAAEGSLLRALDLGAGKEEVTGYLAQAMLAQGDPARAIELIGDLQQWPQKRRLVLAVSRAEAELALTNYDKREATRHIADMFRLRAAAQQHGAIADLSSIDRRLAALREEHATAEAGYEHFACSPAEAGPTEEGQRVPSVGPASAGQEPVDQATAAEPASSSERAATTRRVLKVGPSHELRRPSDAARVARDNDVIEIEGGRYAGDVAFWPQSGLLLRGVNGRPHLDSQGRTARDQGIWVFRGDDIVVENIEFSGARASGRNGSGIRFFGRNLTIRDSHFHHNEDGVLTWNSPQSDILIERSVFAHNGYGDGQSHNIYIGRIRSFTLRFSHSHDSISGHEVKSRARTNYILYNRLTDEDDGNSSYLIDLPEGGYGYIVGNVLEKGARTENPNAIAFASETPDVERGGLWVINNSFYNRRLDSTFVANRSQLPVVIANNVLAGAPVLLRDGPGAEHHNFRSPDAGMVDPASYDFELTADSALIDAGGDPGSTGETSLWPQFEYVHPASGRKRQRVAAVDIGAYEFCGW